MKSNNTRTHKEALIYLTKRNPLGWKQSLLVRLGAITAGLLFSAVIIMILSKQNPLNVFASLFSGAFGSSRRIWNLLNETSILLGLALALTPAFKMKFWNCGAEGQTLVGGLATAACMFLIGDSVPLPILFIIMILASVLAGAIWAVIPALFKAFFGTNETLFTLMMNYIAIKLIAFFLKVWVKSGSGTLPNMPQFRFPIIIQEYFLNILIIGLACAGMYIYLKYSKQGYEISVVGESENTAKYVGINVKNVVIRTMILSGAFCGLVGLLLVANGSCTISTDVVSGRGFTAILVSWLAKFNPIFMVFTALLVAFLSRGSSQISTDLRLPTAIGDILTAIILLFVIGCEFFLTYKVNFRKGNKEENV